MTIIVRSVSVFFLMLSLSACVHNAPYRTEFVEQHCFDPQVDCSRSVIEKHLVFDLAFIEFTERGNLYDRSRVRQVMDFVDEQANSEHGAAIFVFTHGWKHNAAYNDSNVDQFRTFLAKAAENQVVGRRKVIGIFLGWRGKSSNIPILRETTYWARKSVAEEIGDGGATEIFSELHQILVKQFTDTQSNHNRYKNSYVIIGHSFGAAIVLSALHDVLLHEIIAATGGQRATSTVECDKISRFSDGLILLNPAIEANKIILLKEAVSRCQFNNNQPPLMHILSSEGDTATNRIFPIGQAVNITATSSPKKLNRTVNQRQVTLSEQKLDAITVGNLQQLRTAYLTYDQSQKQWQLNQCKEDLDNCGVSKAETKKNHFPINDHDPLRFITTDTHFIKNHNDVFGCYVQSYISTTIFETQSIDRNYRDGTELTNTSKIEGCNNLNFDFKLCFNNQLEDYDCDTPKS